MNLLIIGHRPPALGGYRPNPVQDWVMQQIDEHIIRTKPDSVLTFLNQGVGFMAANACILNDVPFTVVLPVRDFDSRWPPPTQALFRSLCASARRVEVTSNDPFNRNTLRTRDEWAFNHCDQVLAVWNRRPEGATWMTIGQAVNHRKQITYSLIPEHFVVMARELWEAEEARKAQWRSVMGQRHQVTFPNPLPQLPTPSALVTLMAQELPDAPEERRPAQPAGERATVQLEREDQFAARRKIDVGE